MNTVAYCSPLVPPEWIAAHGLRPVWFTPAGTLNRQGPGVARGVCPHAGAILDAGSAGVDASALVLTTTCDQLRRVSDLVVRDSPVPTMLFNVPVTWQTESSRAFYRDELERLSRFLVSLGGTRPDAAGLTGVMARYQRNREAMLAARGDWSARQFAAMKQFARAKAVLERAYNLSAGDPESARLLALLLLRAPDEAIRDAAKAETYAEVAYTAKPADERCVSAMAEVKWARGEKGKAIELLDGALKTAESGLLRKQVDDYRHFLIETEKKAEPLKEEKKPEGNVAPGA